MDALQGLNCWSQIYKKSLTATFQIIALELRGRSKILLKYYLGAIAKKLLLKYRITFHSKVEELAGMDCSTPAKLELAKRMCLEIAEEGDSTGGIVSLTIKGVPAGVGGPVFNKLHSLIIYVLSTIGGVKGVESGHGFNAARMKGSDFNDLFGLKNGEIVLLSNNSGGVLGGISTGLDLSFRLAIKPTPSIFIAQQTVNWKTRKEELLLLNGRFDKNFAPRVAPIAEAMASMVIADQMILAGHINPVKHVEIAEHVSPVELRALY